MFFSVIKIEKADTVYAAKQAEIRNINFNNEGEIAGITNPARAVDKGSEWKGTYLYFGNYRKGFLSTLLNSTDPLKWRVLDAYTTDYSEEGNPTLLLLSDKVLDQIEFNCSVFLKDNEYFTGAGQYYANQYAYSNIRKWLNSEEFESNDDYTKDGFYYAAFSAAERNAIASSSKAAIAEEGDCSGLSQNGITDKVFLLCRSEVKNPSYGFFARESLEGNKAVVLKATSYAKDRGVAHINDAASWWLRSTAASSNVVDLVSPNGNVGTGNSGNSEVGIAPAVNLNLSSIMFTCAEGQKKETSFKMTKPDKEKEWNTWRLTLAGGEAFTAEWEGENNRQAVVNVTSLGEPYNGVAYTQLSAMLLDDSGTVICYGRVKRKAETGKIQIQIPSDVPKGIYTLKVFAEQVESSNSKEFSDFASNTVDFLVQVLDVGITSVTPTPTPMPSPASTSSPAPTLTLMPSPTPTLTPTPSPTPVPTLTLTPSPTPTLAPTRTLTTVPTLTAIPMPSSSAQSTIPAQLEEQASKIPQDMDVEAQNTAAQLQDKGGLPVMVIIGTIVFLILVFVVAYKISTRKKTGGK